MRWIGHGNHMVIEGDFRCPSCQRLWTDPPKKECSRASGHTAERATTDEILCYCGPVATSDQPVVGHRYGTGRECGPDAHWLAPQTNSAATRTWRPEDLDRCEHGRHSRDNCLGCPGGWSTGNLYLAWPFTGLKSPGASVRIGTDYGGNPIMVTPIEVPEDEAARERQRHSIARAVRYRTRGTPDVGTV